VAGAGAGVLHLQNKILRMIAEGRPVEQTAEALCRSLRGLDLNVSGAVLLAEPDGSLRALTGCVPGTNILRRELRGSDGDLAGVLLLWTDHAAGACQRLEEVAADCADLLTIALERDQVRRENHRLAFHDSLTGLLNRASFTHDLHQQIAEGSAPGLLLIDIDRLKLVNDTSGHEAGDILICEIAARIGKASSPFAAYRHGGDEFAVLMPGCDEADMAATAARVIEAVHHPLAQGELVLNPGVTVGGARLDKPDADSLRQNADFALYHAKEVNSGGYVAYSPDLRTSISSRFIAIRNVGAALEEGRIEAYYQPVVRLDTRAIVGVEALCRIRHLNGSLIAAEQFRPALNDARTARRIAEFMIERVASDVRAWLDMGIPFQHAGLNVMAGDLQCGGLPARLKKVFDRAGVPLKHVVLEVSEGACLGSAEREIAHAMRDIREAGVLIAMDDFGSGYASLTHLLNAPIDILKLDRGLACRIGPGDAGAAIVQSLIDIATRLDIRVVAEGVETSDQVERLLDFGCRLGQGYHFARPADFAQTTSWLERLAQGVSSSPGRLLGSFQAQRA
jgi:diguanylate cyclase (GGDEF)-like protein